MKKLTAFVVSALVIVAGIVSLETISPTESAVEEIWLLLGGDTEYAAGFSHEAFGQIKVGDSEALVYDLVGDPLRTDIYEDGSICLWYSNSPAEGLHRRREILLKDGAVIKVFSELFFD